MQYFQRGLIILDHITVAQMKVLHMA